MDFNLILRKLVSKSSSNVRPLENPLRRRPLRADFPRITEWTPKDSKSSKQDYRTLVLTLEHALNSCHLSISDKPQITIAYPHKRPGFFSKKPHRLVPMAHEFKAGMEFLIPEIKWLVADGLCESVHLKRAKSFNQSIQRTFCRRQIFTYEADLQDGLLPFMSPNQFQDSLFVLYDDYYCQGTTASNMISFIEHNGGHVLMAFTDKSHLDWNLRALRHRSYLTRRDKEKLQITFNNAAFNEGYIPEMGAFLYDHAHSTSPKPPKTVEHCLEQVESALNTQGLSLTTLSNGEFFHLKTYLTGYCTFYKNVESIPYDRFIRMISNDPLSPICA